MFVLKRDKEKELTLTFSWTDWSWAAWATNVWYNFCMARVKSGDKRHSEVIFGEKKNDDERNNKHAWN